MTKREEIREGLAIRMNPDCDTECELRKDCDDLEEPGSPCLMELDEADEILAYLHSQGVVLLAEVPDSGSMAMVEPLIGGE